MCKILPLKLHQKIYVDGQYFITDILSINVEVKRYVNHNSI